MKKGLGRIEASKIGIGEIAKKTTQKIEKSIF